MSPMRDGRTNKRQVKIGLLSFWSVRSWVSQQDNSKLGSTQQQKICWHWHVARIISSQKIYSLYARKHHIVEMRGDVTDAWRRQQQLKIELLSQWKLEAESRKYRATQLLIREPLSFAIWKQIQWNGRRRLTKSVEDSQVTIVTKSCEPKSGFACILWKFMCCRFQLCAQLVSCNGCFFRIGLWT